MVEVTEAIVMQVKTLQCNTIIQIQYIRYLLLIDIRYESACTESASLCFLKHDTKSFSTLLW